MGWSKCDCSIDTSLVSRMDWILRLKIVMVRKLLVKINLTEHCIHFHFKFSFFLGFIFLFISFIYNYRLRRCAKSNWRRKTWMWQQKCQNKQRNIWTWIQKKKGFGNERKKYCFSFDEKCAIERFAKYTNDFHEKYLSSPFTVHGRYNCIVSHLIGHYNPWIIHENVFNDLVLHNWLKLLWSLFNGWWALFLIKCITIFCFGFFFLSSKFIWSLCTDEHLNRSTQLYIAS